jgi:hypothetical protein
LATNGGAGTTLTFNGTQIGWIASSRRYKTDIQDMEDKKDVLDRLRPVTFKYKKTDQESFGLIAEEVVEVLPEMVPLDMEGLPVSVRYDMLSVILLQELKKSVSRLEECEAILQALNA